MSGARAHTVDAARPVLIVDDNAEVREALGFLLSMEGYESVEASNGAAALALLKRGTEPCMILLDYHMPVMDGLAFRREQVSDRALADIPVVLYSGAFDVKDQARALHVEHVFQKPLDLASLVDVVRRYC
jgi:CheY-like chemotaxis protein